MYQRRNLGDFTVNLPPGLIQTNVSPEAATAASQASIDQLTKNPVVWILTGLLAFTVLKGRR